MFDALGIRMKNNYESIPNNRLIRKTPVIIRIDGKAFHTFSRGFQRPFDTILAKSIQETAFELCKNIQNAKLAYCQSDEISILMIDYTDLKTEAWFENKIQKIVSISASMATLYFNRIFKEKLHEYLVLCENLDDENYKKHKPYLDAYLKAYQSGAMFDARCFNVPREEVTNYFLWRQNDATRNSIQMAAQAYYSHKELMYKSTNDMQSMLLEKDINWNDYPTYLKRGTAIIKGRCGWRIDKEMPILKNEGRDYVEKYLYPEFETEK